MKVITHKECSKCGEMKPVGEFTPQADGLGGVMSICKACRGEYRRQPSRRAQANAYKRKYERERYRDDPEFRESKRARNEQWRARRSEAYLAVAALAGYADSDNLPWEDDELAIVADHTRTVGEVAHALHRSIPAVRAMRKTLTQDGAA